MCQKSPQEYKTGMRFRRVKFMNESADVIVQFPVEFRVAQEKQCIFWNVKTPKSFGKGNKRKSPSLLRIRDKGKKREKLN